MYGGNIYLTNPLLDLLVVSIFHSDEYVSLNIWVHLSGFLKFLKKGIAGLNNMDILKAFDTCFLLLSRKFVSKQIHHEIRVHVFLL